MACIYRDIAGMKKELRTLKFENPTTKWKVYDEPSEMLAGATDDEIVILFNIHCMPSKYESSKGYSQPYSKTTRKNKNHG